MKKLLFVLSITLLAVKAYAWVNPQSVTVPSSVIVSSAGVTGAAVTVTLSTASVGSGQGAFSAGYNDYITNVHIEGLYLGGVNSPATATCTSTNIAASNPQWLVGLVSSNTVSLTDMQFANPLLVVNNSSNTVITCPATANTKWNVIVGHFVAP
jgi:hypothetical protein